MRALGELLALRAELADEIFKRQARLTELDGMIARMRGQHVSAPGGSDIFALPRPVRTAIAPVTQKEIDRVLPVPLAALRAVDQAADMESRAPRGRPRRQLSDRDEKFRAAYEAGEKTRSLIQRFNFRNANAVYSRAKYLGAHRPNYSGGQLRA